MKSTKEILVIDGEIIKEAIKMLIEDFGRLHLLQISDGLKTLFDTELTSDEFLRAVTSLNDCDFLSQHIHGYYKINKKWLGYTVSKARMDRIEMLRKRYNEVKKELKKQLES